MGREIRLTIVRAKNWKEKLLGLIGKKKAYPLLLQTRFGIHTFGLKFPIDILVLDKNNKIVKIKKSLKPNRIFLWNPIHDMVIELPEGFVNRQSLKMGDAVKVR